MKKKTLKAVLIGNRGLGNILKLGYSGNQLTKLNEQMKDVKPGAVLEVTICEPNKLKSLEQNNTFHLLWSMYWDSGLPSDLTKEKLRNRLKYEYGVHEYFEMKDGSIQGTLKSISKYTLKEYSPLIDGTIKEMLLTGYSGKRFDEMIQEWNRGNNESSN